VFHIALVAWDGMSADPPLAKRASFAGIERLKRRIEMESADLERN